MISKDLERGGPFMCDQHGTIMGHLLVDSLGPIARVAFP